MKTVIFMTTYHIIKDAQMFIKCCLIIRGSGGLSVTVRGGPESGKPPRMRVMLGLLSETHKHIPVKHVLLIFLYR